MSDNSRKRGVLLTVVAVLAFMLVVVSGFIYRIGQPRLMSDSELQANGLYLMDPPRDIGEFELVDHRGDPFTQANLEGRWSLLFFGFTHCPDICPMTLGLLRQARDQLVSARGDDVPRIVLVSVDPERDTPDALAEYINYFGDENLGITGDLEEVRKLTDALGIFFAKAELEDGDYTVDHSTVVLVIDPEGRFRALFSAPHSIDGFVHDLPLIMAMQ